MAAFLTLPESLRLMWWMPPAWYRGGMVIPPSLAVPRWLGVFTCRLQQPFLFFAGYIIFRQTIMRTYIQLYIYIYLFLYDIYIYIHAYTSIPKSSFFLVTLWHIAPSAVVFQAALANSPETLRTLEECGLPLTQVGSSWSRNHWDVYH